jgi:hypothetical protein
VLGNIQGKLVESAARCIQILRMLLHVACMHLHTHVRASLDVDAQAPTCSRCMAGAVDQDEHQDSAKSKSVYSVLVALSSRNFHINGKVTSMANGDVVIFRGNQCHNAAAVPVEGTRTLGLHLYMGAGDTHTHTHTHTHTQTHAHSHTQAHTRARTHRHAST